MRSTVVSVRVLALARAAFSCRSLFRAVLFRLSLAAFLREAFPLEPLAFEPLASKTTGGALNSNRPGESCFYLPQPVLFGRFGAALTCLWPFS